MTMAGTVPVAASLAIEEPNLSGTPTLAATLYIKDAPTEGVTNAAIHVAAGDVRLPSSVVVEGQDTAKFIADLYNICGDIRFLWMPSLTGTTVTDKSRHAATVTYSKEIGSWDTPPSLLGRGIAATFDKTDEEGDTPDSDIHSFGDGVNDNPFSVLSLVKPSTDLTSAGKTIISRYNWGGSLEEWGFSIRHTSGRMVFELHDAGANAAIGAEYGTNLGSDWALVSGTYDGAGLSAGCKVYKNAAEVQDTAFGTGSYVAMENKAQVMAIGHNLNNSTPTNLFGGSIAFILITAKELNADEQWAIKNLVNAFYNLAL